MAEKKKEKPCTGLLDMAVTKERADPVYTGQINLKEEESISALHHLMFLPCKLIKCVSELIACMRAAESPT